MSRQKKFFSFLLVSLLLISCSGKDKTNTVPQAQDPNAGNNIPLPTPTTNTDNRIPEWVSRSAGITLVSNSDLSNLETIFGIVYPPLVGDPKIGMDINSSRTNKVSGKLYIGMEDDRAFTWREWSSLDTMSNRTSSALDGWFLDDEMVVRVTGGISGSPSSVQGQIKFRKRVSGETQCIPSTVQYCAQWHQPAYFAPGYCGFDSNQDCFNRTGCQRDSINPDYVWCCERYDSYENLDTSACSSYMNNPSVKTLGTFNVVYDKWLK